MDWSIESELRALWEVAALAMGAACCASLLLRAVQLAAVRLPRPGPALPGASHGALSLVTLCLALSSSAGGKERPRVPPALVRSASPPPWAESSGYPPPPLARSEAPWRSGPVTAHPAIHAGRDDRGFDGARLFPRAGRVNEPEPRRAHRASGPAESLPKGCRSQHVVRAGDTLWDIAAATLDTADPRRVARYWPRIHRANRAVIGPDPSLIRPGQVLFLPPDCP